MDNQRQDYMRRFCIWSLKYETDCHRIEQVLDIYRQKDFDGMLHEEEPSRYGYPSNISPLKQKAEAFISDDKDSAILAQVYDIFYQAYLDENKYPETEEEWEQLIEESECEEAEGRGIPHEEVVKTIDAMFA